MAKAIVQHHVADYDQWLPIFIEHGEVRRQYGATGHTVTRSSSDPNDLVIVNDFATLEGAVGFAHDPSLPDVMHRAGVDSAPQVWIVEDADAARY